MRILYIHNEYAKLSGEEQASREIVDLLREHGHEVKWFSRSSEEISKGILGHIKAFVAGIYNPFSAKKLAKVLDEFKPDIVQVQNIYPLLSSAIFTPLKKRHIPVVMRCPNYRLFCPSGLSIDPKGQVCELCWGGHEINCIKRNCLGNYSKSIGYALRNMYNRLTSKIKNGVSVYIVQSEFQKNKFISQGISPDRIGILPGISPVISIHNDNREGEYVSFVGRVSKEKGIYEFIETAKLNPNIPFRVAGNFDENFVMPSVIPDNLNFVGFKRGKELDEFYLDSRIIVVPSKWYEGFPNVIVRGMLLKKPIITTSIGAMQSIVDHNSNGLLVAPGSAEELSQAIHNLYYNLDDCKKFGENGYLKATSQYSREQIYRELVKIYKHAQESLI